MIDRGYLGLEITSFQKGGGGQEEEPFLRWHLLAGGSRRLRDLRLWILRRIKDWILRRTKVTSKGGLMFQMEGQPRCACDSSARASVLNPPPAVYGSEGEFAESSPTPHASRRGASPSHLPAPAQPSLFCSRSAFHANSPCLLARPARGCRAGGGDKRRGGEIITVFPFRPCVSAKLGSPLCSDPNPLAVPGAVPGTDCHPARYHGPASKTSPLLVSRLLPAHTPGLPGPGR